MNALCGRMRKKLDDYIDGTLGKNETERIRAHLASCGACRSMFKEGQQLIRELSDLPRLCCPGRVTDSILEHVDPGGKAVVFPAWKEWILGRRAWRPALVCGLALVLAFALKYQIPKKFKRQPAYSPEEIRQAVDAVKWSMAFSAKTIQQSEAQAIGVLANRLPKTIRRSVRMALPTDGGNEP